MKQLQSQKSGDSVSSVIKAAPKKSVKRQPKSRVQPILKFESNKELVWSECGPLLSSILLIFKNWPFIVVANSKNHCQYLNLLQILLRIQMKVYMRKRLKVDHLIINRNRVFQYRLVRLRMRIHVSYLIP